MNCYPKVEDDVVALSWYHSGNVKMCGSSTPIVPCGSFVDKMVFEGRRGLQAMIFFSRNDEPQRKGSGKTAWLDETPRLESCVLLMWEEGDITIVKEDDNMSAAELAMFNPFTRSGTEVTVVDASRKIAYVVAAERMVQVDPTWTYKKVSGDALAAYIAKHSTLEELDAAAESELAARNELAELREIARQASRDCADARNETMNVAAAMCFFAEMVRELLTHPFFSNKYGRRVAQQFGIDGTVLGRIISKSGGNEIETDKLLRAVLEEQIK